MKKHNNNIFLSVSDAGAGIPEGCPDKIFGRFYHVDKPCSRDKGGYGLELVIDIATVENNIEEKSL